ncbi:hypothetical protein KQ51_01788 [Candidatus Izimaplasma bacterium HR1]|jgi:uncharacterized protein YlbG (UPF0298 family)|uniref:DUF2129 domain-containing protein n=1 Tax=Candidatus Izimoplasma sp. HR1 TaxID=1541959 RepID=UPI0004F91825|nr:hypothetical protein KQ51_01788 [Candidatus Izimaplasma bacterium HR1]
MIKRKSLIVHFRTPKAVKLIENISPVIYYNKKRRYAICYVNEQEQEAKTNELRAIKLVKRVEESLVITDEYQIDFDVK